MSGLFDLKKIRNKLILALVLVTLIPITMIGGYALYSSTSTLRENGLNNQITKLALTQQQIENYFSGINSDLLFLRDSSALGLYLSALDSGKAHSENLLLTNLRNSFIKFARQKNVYSQVRFIDTNGLEVVRINQTDGQTRNVPSSELQNKIQEAYVTETLSMDNDGIYISPLGLNREEGEIQKPITPTIQFATPVFDKGNKKQGIIVLNLKVDGIMQILSNASSNDEQTLLIAEDGSYYYHRDPSKVWGGANDLNSGENFFTDFADLKDNFNKNKDTLDTNDDVISYTNVKIDDSKVLGKAINITPKATMFKAANQFLYVFIGIIVLALILALLIAILLSNSISKPIESLTESVNDLSKGDLENPIDIQTNDEINELSKAIERLRKSMNILMRRAS
jgi:methyl-accepting chemotaxis protein